MITFSYIQLSSAIADGLQGKCGLLLKNQPYNIDVMAIIAYAKPLSTVELLE